MTEAARYILHLRAEPSPVPPIVRLRGLLKVALRRFGLRCIDVAEQPAPAAASGTPGIAGMATAGQGRRRRKSPAIATGGHTTVGATMNVPTIDA